MNWESSTVSLCVYIYTHICFFNRYIFENKRTWICQLSLERVTIKARLLQIIICINLCNWYGRHSMILTMGWVAQLLMINSVMGAKAQAFRISFSASAVTSVSYGWGELKISFWCLIRDPAEPTCWVWLLTSSNNLLEGSTSCTWHRGDK